MVAKGNTVDTNDFPFNFQVDLSLHCQFQPFLFKVCQSRYALGSGWVSIAWFS